MPVLSNVRHERFAQELAKGKTATEAYEIAGYKPNRHNGAALARQEHIQTRVAAIQSEAAQMARKASEKAVQRLSVTVEGLIAEADEARLLAMRLGQPAAAIAAIKEKGVLAMLRVEKSERRNTHDVAELPESELDAAIADALAREEAAAERPQVAH